MKLNIKFLFFYSNILKIAIIFLFRCFVKTFGSLKSQKISFEKKLIFFIFFTLDRELQ